MAIATVHLNQTNTAASGITLTTTIASTTAGNCLIVFFCTDAATGRPIHDITDNGTHTNTWFKLINNGASGQDLEIWCSLNVPAGITSVTVNLSGPLAGGQILVNINEFSGVARASATDSTQSSAGTSTSPITGTTASLTSSADLAIGAFTHTATTSPSAGPTNSYTALTAVIGTGIRLDPAYKILTSNAATSIGWTITSATWAGAIATLTPLVGERVSQAVLQVAATPSSNERVSQAVLQVAAQATANERVSQSVLQVAAQATANERVSQSVLQVAAIPSYQNSVINATHTNTGAAAASLTLTKPTNTVSGNLIIASIGFAGDPGSVNITPASGFALVQYASAISTHGAIATYWKYAGGSEPSTYTFSWSGGNQIASGGMITIAGPTFTNPFGQMANGGSTSTTAKPLTVILTPQQTYSMILEILAWNGSQTFTAPIGPWSQWWVDNNASGMSTALSARNWDTGTTIQQTGTLSGSPTEYTSASIEILGLIVPPLYRYREHLTPRLIESAGLAAITYSPFKAAATLYDRMKRIGFPVGVKTYIENLSTSVSLLPILKKALSALFTSTLITTTVTSLKSIVKILASTAVSLTAIIINGVIYTTSLVSTPINVIASLLKSVRKTLISTTINLGASFLKSILIPLISTTISLTTTLLKSINRFLISTIISTIVTLSKQIIKILISSIILLITSLLPSLGIKLNTTVNLTVTILSTINKILNTTVSISATLLKSLSIILLTIISIISSLFKGILEIITTSVSNLAISLKSASITLSSNVVSLTATLDHFIALILSTTTDLLVTIEQNVLKILATNVIILSTIIKSLPKTLITSISNIVTLLQNNIITLITTVDITAMLQYGPAFLRLLITTVDITTSFFKEIIFTMISRIVFTFSSMNKELNMILNAVISVIAILTNSIGKIFFTIVNTISNLIGESVPTLSLYMPLSQTLMLYCSLNNSGKGLNLYMDLDPEAKSKVI